MGKKKLLGLSALLLFVQTTAAQTTGGIIPLLAEVLGLPIGGNIYTAIGTAAILGEMIILLYIPMKIGAKKLGIEDSVLGGSGRHGGRNIALILSTLMVLSLLGVTAQGFGFTFGSIIEAYGALSIIAVLGIGILGIFITFAFLGNAGPGMLSLTSSTGGALKADATSQKADNLQAEASAMESMNEARERMRSVMEETEEIDEEVRGAEEEAEEGASDGSEEEEEEAVERVRNALNALKNEADKFPDELRHDENELQDAIEDAKKALSVEGDVKDKEIELHRRLERVDIYLNESGSKAQSELSSGNDPEWLDVVLGEGDYADIWGSDMPNEIFDSSKSLDELGIQGVPAAANHYGLYAVLADLQRAEEEIQLIENEIRSLDASDGPLVEEFQDLLEATESATDFAKELRAMKQTLQDIHSTDEEIEEIAENYDWRQLYHEADENEDIEQQIRNRLSNLSDVEDDLIEKIEEAYKLLKKQVIGLDDQLEVLNNLSGDSPGMIGSGTNPLLQYAEQLDSLAESDGTYLNTPGSDPDTRLLDVSATGLDTGDNFVTDIGGDNWLLMRDGSTGGIIGAIEQDTDEMKAPLEAIAEEQQQMDHEERDILEEVANHLNEVGVSVDSL